MNNLNWTPITQPNMLIRSENCTDLVEESKKNHEAGLNRLLCSFSIIGLIIVFLPMIISLNNNSSQEAPISLPVALITAAVVIVIWILTSKAREQFNEVYEKYKQYCSTEVLIVEDTRIFGSTAKGNLTLTYDQIDSVRFMPNLYSPEEKKPVIPNDILTIRDIAGNEFIFYSFKNCKDLKVIIDTRLRRA